MNVHLVRSTEVSEELYWDIVDMLQQFKGPAKYISSESYTSYENKVMTTEFVEDEEKFTSRDIMFSLSMNREPFTPYKRKVLSWEQIFDVCRQYREARDIGKEEYVILLTNLANDKNWFMSMSDTSNDAFIHADDWDYYLHANPKFPIAYQVVEMLLHSHMAIDLKDLMKFVHQRPIGCISDLAENKTDITLKLRTADICPACQEIIQKRKVPTALVNQVLNTMEGIRHQMLFKERFSYHLRPGHILFDLTKRTIFFTDIQGMSLKLTPLEATVYCFFLKEKDGIFINSIHQYEEVLYEMYKHSSVASSDNNIAAMRNSIRALVNPLENSLNEKISRIKKKLVKELGEEFAEFYYIQKDNESGKHLIKIDRELVKMAGSQ